MRLLRSVGVNFRRASESAYFVVAIAAAFVLMFFNTVGSDFQTNDNISVFNLLINRDLISTALNYSSIFVILNSTPGWVAMFAPILAAFAYIPVFCAERRSETNRMLIIRQSRARYALGHIFAAMLTGGIVMSLASLLFSAVIMFALPSPQDYPQTDPLALQALTANCPRVLANAVENGQFLLPILFKALAMFLSGALMSLPALLLASFVQNEYVVLCPPFFVFYVWSQIQTKVSEDYMDKLLASFDGSGPAPSHAYEMFMNFLSNAQPIALMQFFQIMDYDILIIHGVAAFLTATVFYIILQRKVDCGA